MTTGFPPAEDYKYLLSAMQSHPDRLLGVFVADPMVTEPEKWMEDIAESNKNWVARRAKKSVKVANLTQENPGSNYSF